MSKWTPAQVKELWDGQFNRMRHPYTCANRSDGNHLHIGSDTGMLIPTINGWMCPFCSYTQGWSHETSTAGVIVGGGKETT